MTFNDEQTRQMFGCGWAPIPPERLRSFVKVPAPLKFEPLRDNDGNEMPRECPGYTTRLPEVVEVSHARFWKHDLQMWCDGKPRPELLLGIQVLEHASNEVNDAKMRKVEDGGIG